MSGIIAQNTLLSSGLIKAPAGGGAWTFISKQTASSSSTLSFTSGIDSTYDEYVFTFKNIHPSNDAVHFHFNFSIDSGSNYNVTKTTSMFRSWHKEDDSAVALAYDSGYDLGESTAFQPLAQEQSSDNDEACSGTMHLFDPSSTTFIKHYTSTLNMVNGEPMPMIMYGSGYGNTTSAVDAIQFKMSAGNIDAGDICLYGISS